MSHCIQKGHLRVYEEMRPQLHEGRDEERPSRSLGRPSASERHKDPSKVIQHRSKSSPTCRTLKVHQGRPFAAHAAEESSSRQRLDGAQRPAAASPALFKHLSTAARGARQKLCICMLGRGSMSTRWLGVRTWDLDLPPLNRPSRRRCCPASRRFRSATRRTSAPLTQANFWG